MTFDKKQWAKDNKEKMHSYREKYKKNNLEKYKAMQEDYDKNRKDKVKARVRQKTNYHNEKNNVCHDCHEGVKTEFHHLSYSPNIFIELCRNCYKSRHLEEDLI